MDCPYNLARIHTLSCRIGDILEISTDTEFTPWDRAWKQIAKAGSRYKVVGLIGSAWEMEILSGSGPQEIRLLNSEIPKYTISITKGDHWVLYPSTDRMPSA